MVDDACTNIGVKNFTCKMHWKYDLINEMKCF